VKGFAATLGIGILTTLFTAFTLTQLIVAYWVKWRRPKTLPVALRPLPKEVKELELGVTDAALSYRS
jgi:hypothetical protein